MMATKSKSSAIFDGLNTVIVGLNPTRVIEAYLRYSVLTVSNVCRGFAMGCIPKCPNND
jgi:hypothetical protein